MFDVQTLFGNVMLNGCIGRRNRHSTMKAILARDGLSHCPGLWPPPDWKLFSSSGEIGSSRGVDLQAKSKKPAPKKEEPKKEAKKEEKKEEKKASASFSCEACFDFRTLAVQSKAAAFGVGSIQESWFQDWLSGLDAASRQSMWWHPSPCPFSSPSGCLFRTGRGQLNRQGFWAIHMCPEIGRQKVKLI